MATFTKKRYILILVNMNNIKNIKKMPVMDVCTYKVLKNELNFWQFI